MKKNTGGISSAARDSLPGNPKMPFIGFCQGMDWGRPSGDPDGMGDLQLEVGLDLGGRFFFGKFPADDFCGQLSHPVFHG